MDDSYNIANHCDDLGQEYTEWMFHMHTSSILHHVLLPDGALVYTAAIDKLIVISSVWLSNSVTFLDIIVKSLFESWE